jgi:hypothetical protein
MSPRLYVLVGLFLAGLLTGSVGAWKVQGWRQAALEHARQAQQQRDTQKRIDRVQEAAAGHEQFKAEEEIRYVTVTKVVTKLVDRPVYRNVCLDDDGRRMLNDYATGAVPGAGEPAAAVPRSATP